MIKGKLSDQSAVAAWQSAQVLNGLSGTSLAQAQQAGLEAFKQASFPNTKHEEWKYTSVAKLIEAELAFPAEAAITADDLRAFAIAGMEDAVVLTFVNGIYTPSLSQIADMPAGLSVMNLKEACKQEATLIAQHLGKHATLSETPFVALNTALAMHGVFVHAKRGKAIERPILMLHVADARQASPLAQPRHLIVAEENSQVTVVERYVSLGGSTAVVNAVTEVSVAPYAIVDHYSIQEEGEAVSHIGLLQAKQGNNSHFSNTAIFLGDGLVRKNLNISLDGQHAEGYMNGLYLLGGRAHVDNHTMVDHRVPNCYSNELYKGVLDGQSRGVFNGKIFVRQDAQKTNAFQSNNNILLSDKAVVDTKPQLEIWADDVKCSHGATVGTLNEEPMFYLRSRGIPEAKAKALLTFAFAADVLERIKLAPLKAYIATEIAKRLGYEQI